MESRGIRYTNRIDPNRKYGFKMLRSGHAVFFAGGDDLVVMSDGAEDPAVEETIRNGVLENYDTESLIREAESEIDGSLGIYYQGGSTGRPPGAVEVELLHRDGNGLNHLDEPNGYLEEMEDIARALARQTDSDLTDDAVLHFSL